MFSPRILIVFVALWSLSTQNVVFKDDSSDASAATYGDSAPSTGIRSGPLDDSVVVEAAGGDTNTRFFGGALGVVGLLGGGGKIYFPNHVKSIFLTSHYSFIGYRPIGGGIGGNLVALLIRKSECEVLPILFI